MSSAFDSRADGSVLAVVEPIVRARGLDLDELAVQRAGRRRLVRLVVDRDGGITLDECAEVSREVSAALDEADAMGESAYVLEVTSPGIDRPLTRERHWRRNVGRLVRVEFADGGGLSGRIVSAGPDEAVVAPDGVATGARPVPYASVRRARIEIEFSTPADRAPAGTGPGEE